MGISTRVSSSSNWHRNASTVMTTAGREQSSTTTWGGSSSGTSSTTGPACEEALCATTFAFNGCYWVCGSSSAGGGSVGVAGTAGGKHALETGHGGGAGVIACWLGDGATTEK